jgi:hypothetical protein
MAGWVILGTSHRSLGSYTHGAPQATIQEVAVFEANPSPVPSAGSRRRRRRALYLVGLGISALGPGGAIAATPPTATEAGFAISLIAAAPKGVTNCANIASLDGHLFLACENAASTNGSGNSTIAEYTENGYLINAWSIPGEAGGIGADQLNHRVIVTLNKDANSHLATITPSAPSGQQVTNYKYSPGAPDSPTTTGALHTGGGTDSVGVDSTGNIYITASHATARTGTAVFRVGLSPPTSPGGTGTAALSPTFLDNTTASNGNSGSGTVALSLGDVGSGAIVPYSSPLYAGSFVVDDQRARMLMFAGNINAGTGLTALKTPLALDAIRWTTAANGALYVVDKGAPAARGVSSIYSVNGLYKVTGPFVPGVAFASTDNGVVTVNLTTGALTPFVRNLTLAKGLVYLDQSGIETPLGLAPLAATTAPDTAVSGTGGSEDYTAVLLVLVFVLLIIGGGYEFSRRRQRTG